MPVFAGPMAADAWKRGVARVVRVSSLYPDFGCAYKRERRVFLFVEEAELLLGARITI